MLTANDSFIPYDENVDFPVALAKVRTVDGVDVPHSRAVVRTDTGAAISMVSDRYKVITHRSMLDAAEPFIKELGKPEIKITPERGGARMLAVFTFKNHTIAIGDKNRAALQITMRSGYHTGQAATVEVSCLVVECLNMCIASMQSIFALSVRHAGDITDIKFPKPVVVLESFLGQKRIMDQYTAVKVEEERGALFLGDENEPMAAAMPARSRARVTDHWLKEKEGRTAWDLLQHCTSEITHQSTNLSLTGRLHRLGRVARLFNTEFAGY